MNNRSLLRALAIAVLALAAGAAIAIGAYDAGVAQGMTPDEVSRMFDRFYKRSTSRGSGLGLAIAKGIVSAHGGAISASSQVGRGTTVTFTLPRSAAD